jgi:Tfp pilus assembly major pilin PilA
MRIRLTLLIGLFGLTLNGCRTAEQEATTALRKACAGIVNKVQAPTITIQKTSTAATYTTEAADQGPRNIWEAAELARTW